MTTTMTSELTSVNPASGEPVGHVTITPVDEIPAILQRAHDAQSSWAAMSMEQRIKTLTALIPAFEARAKELGHLVTNEMGKPLAEGMGEVEYGINGLAGELEELTEALAPENMSDGTTCSTLYRDPLGVAVAITPWNFPFLMPLQVVIPALAAGNTVVMKPSEEVPLIGQAFAEVCMSVLPQDVLQIVHGADDQGKALVRGDCNLIAFVGSRAAGQDILSAAGSGLKRVVLELGGKDPMIVLNDADLNKAAAFAVRNSFRNCGQVCVSTERIYVEDGIADEFEAKVAEGCRNLIVGAGTDDEVQIGPMVSSAQKQMVLDQLEQAKHEGATVVCGDEPMEGNFVRPTVLTGLSHDMAIMHDETFGPMLNRPSRSPTTRRTGLVPPCLEEIEQHRSPDN